MIDRLLIFVSGSFDPHRNLAVEEVLLNRVPQGQCILYLWQNENTVVIGKNQNPWKECKTALLQQEGGKLARRLSGGGAVYHDLGNLNFTFLMPQADYDPDRQFAVIARAVESLGIPVERSGRNDMLVAGRKFSGNAFYKNGRQAYHHGTLLVAADMERMGRYLSPSRAKLQSKGVDSVCSRVANLREFSPELTVDSLKAALIRAFSQVYGLPVTALPPEALEEATVAALTARNRSWEWNYGQKLPFSLEWEHRFSWGGVQVRLQVTQGVIRAARIYSDAMDALLIPAWEKALTGCRLESGAMAAAFSGLEDPQSRELCQLLTQQL